MARTGRINRTDRTDTVGNKLQQDYLDTTFDYGVQQKEEDGEPVNQEIYDANGHRWAQLQADADGKFIKDAADAGQHEETEECLGYTWAIVNGEITIVYEDPEARPAVEQVTIFDTFASVAPEHPGKKALKESISGSGKRTALNSTAPVASFGDALPVREKARADSLDPTGSNCADIQKENSATPDAGQEGPDPNRKLTLPEFKRKIGWKDEEMLKPGSWI